MTALITGASSGIGRDIARYLASLNYDLILVARREDRLLELKNDIKNVKVDIIVSDLSVRENCVDLFENTKDRTIDFLVNNAGFGAYGKFDTVPLEEELRLIDTNIVALHILTKLFLKDMKKRNSGYILNVGSASAFLPGPTFSSYYASKSYVVRLTQGIYEELRRDKSNVKISALCPGPVKTEFNKVANVGFAISGLESEYVAKYAVDNTIKGKMVITPGRLMKVLKFLERFPSEKMLAKISYNIQHKRKQ